jgi:hypothetical protein
VSRCGTPAYARASLNRRGRGDRRRRRYGRTRPGRSTLRQATGCKSPLQADHDPLWMAMEWLRRIRDIVGSCPRHPLDPLCQTKVKIVPHFCVSRIETSICSCSTSARSRCAQQRMAPFCTCALLLPGQIATGQRESIPALGRRHSARTVDPWFECSRPGVRPDITERRPHRGHIGGS